MTEPEPNSDKLSGFKCPWDIMQILTWLLSFVVSGWIFFLTGSDKGGLNQSVIPLFAKIITTLFTVTVTIVCTTTDPTDELFYLDWNGHDTLAGDR
jgi:hypothetical protein